MTRPSSMRTFDTTAVALLTTVFALIPSLATAQQNAASVKSSTPDESVAIAIPVTQVEPTGMRALPDERLQVGDATYRLLAMQREGSAASTTSRPLAGEVASLSYKRYLDSFKFPIPERFSAAVQKSGSAGGQ